VKLAFSLLALGKRIQLDASHEPLRWDKDDDEALDFVTAASNLRATIFGIPQKTRFDVKGK
jgi:ubiquitin-like 1-activating enzyme E1 B